MEMAVLDGSLAPEALAAMLQAGPDLTQREAVPTDLDGVKYAGRFGVRPPGLATLLRHSALSLAAQCACLVVVRTGGMGVTPPDLITAGCLPARDGSNVWVVDALLRHLVSHVPPADAQSVRLDGARVVLFFALFLRAQLSIKVFDDGIDRSGCRGSPLPPPVAGGSGADKSHFDFGDRGWSALRCGWT